MNNSIEFTFLSRGSDKLAGDIERITKLGRRAVVTAGLMGSAAGGGADGVKKLSKETDNAASSQDRFNKSIDEGSQRQKNYFAHIARTTIQSALINKAFLGLTDSLSRATRQVDLIENFPGVMGALGVSTDSATESMAKLRTYVEGVGGDLAAATGSVARFVAVNKSAEASVAMYAGINNALIAGGAEATAQQAALEQLTQGYARGRIEGEEFRSMQTAMNLAMTEAATALDLPSTQHLQEALNNGELSLNRFMATLAQVSTTGAVADTAMAQMQGIGFAMTVMSNTLTNGLTAIYQAVGRQNIVAFFNMVTQVIATLAGWIVGVINLFIGLFNVIAKLFGGSGVKQLEGDTGGVASNLDAGAGSAGDLADGLGGAGKAAKKLHKQLAGFDQMNVLQEKEPAGGGGGGSGGGGGGAAGGGAFDPTEMDMLGDIFDNITSKMKEASTFAKILAGIIAGIAAVKFAQGIINQLDGIGKAFGKARGAVGKFKSALTPMPTDGLDEVEKRPTIIAGNFGKLGRLLANPWVAAIAVIVGAIAILYNANEDFKEGFHTTWDPIWETLNDIYDFMMNQLLVAWNAVKDEAIKLWEAMDIELPQWLEDLLEDLGLLEGGMGSAGAMAGILAGALALIVAAPLLLVIGTIMLIGVAIVAVISAILWLGEAFGIGLEMIYGFFVWALNGIVDIWNGIPGFFSGIWDGIVEAFNNVVEWFGRVFSAAWEAIKNAWNKVVGWFGDVWNGIVSIFSVVTTWFGGKFTDAWEGIKNIWSAVTGWFGDVWNGIVKIFSVVGQWFGGKFTGAWNDIKKIWGAVTGWFGSVWTGIKNIFNNVGGWLGDKFRQAWNNIKNVFGGVGGFFRGVWDTIKNIFTNIGSSIGSAVGGAFKSVVNTVIGFAERSINGFIRGINLAVGIINKIPGVNIGKISTLNIPRLARGGVVSRPTLAEIGEAGAEAVVPLENNTEWIDKLAKKINGKSGGGEPIQVVVQIGEERIVDQVIELINEKTQMTGRTVINV